MKTLFRQIPVFSLIKEKLHQVDPADRQKIQELSQYARKAFEQLLEASDSENYLRAKTYLTDLYHSTMAFLDHRLRTKQWLLLKTSLVESVSSRITSRVKNIGGRRITPFVYCLGLHLGKSLILTSGPNARTDNSKLSEKCNLRC